MTGERKRDRNPWVLAARYTSLAMVLPACTAVGYIMGYLLDRWLGTRWLYLVFLLVGIAAGFIQFVREIQKDTRNGGR